jgi:O-antigen ligase
MARRRERRDPRPERGPRRTPTRARAVGAGWEIPSMEALWLATIVVVPLVFLTEASAFSPFRVAKVTLVHVFVALLVTLWALHWARVRRTVSVPRDLGPSLAAWLRGNPNRWIFAAFAGYVFATVLAVATSMSFRTSLWGGFPGDDGYGLYNMAAYFVGFLVVATNVRTPSQIWRLVGAVAVVGAIVGVYAVAQRAGFDPFGFPKPGGRVVGTLGNPVFAGSLFVLTIPMTASLVGRYALGRSFAATAIWTVAAALQVCGLLFTESRGPVLGLAATFAVAVVVIVLSPGRIVPRLRVGHRWLMLAGGAVLIVAAVSGLALSLGKDRPLDQFGLGQSARQFDRLFDSSVGNRIWIWEGSARLIMERPAPAFYDDRLFFLRPLVGYGPDLFPYVFPLRAPPELKMGLAERVTTAHNHIIHLWVETGFLGAAAYVALILAAAAAGIRGIRRGLDVHPATRLLLIALVATIIGRMVDMSFGVATVGDQTVFWALLALLVALPVAFSDVGAISGGPAAEAPSPPTVRTLSIQAPVAWGLSGAVVLLAVAVPWFHSVDYLRASNYAANSIDLVDAGELTQGLERIERAVELAPDVVEYRLQEAAIYRIGSQESEGADVQVRFARLALEAAEVAAELQPFSTFVAIETAKAARVLTEQGDPGATGALLANLFRLADLRVHQPKAQELAASALIRDGRPRDAVVYATRGIDAAEAMANGLPAAEMRAKMRVVRAIAHLGAGEFESALADAVEALDINRTSRLASSTLKDILGAAEQAVVRSVVAEAEAALGQ